MSMEKLEERFEVNKWIKKFADSEKVMKREFLPQYKLAKDRLQCRYQRKYSSKQNDPVTHDQVNLVYSIGSNYINSVYFKSPNCNLKAREKTERIQIENTEVFVNDWLQDKKVSSIIKRILWDAYLGGFGARAIFYNYDDIDSGIPITQQEVTGTDFAGQEIIEEVPMTDPEGNVVTKKIVTKNEIELKRIRPDLMRFPKGFDFSNFQDSPWLGFVMLFTREDVKGEKWPEEIKEKLQYSKYEKVSGSEGSQEGSSEEYCKINYLYEKRDRMMLTVFSDGLESPLEEREETSGVVGYPVKFIFHNPLDDDTSYPNGDPFIWEPQLKAIDQWWALMCEHTARSLPRTFYDSGRVKKAEVMKAKSTRTLEYVGIENKDKAPLDSLFYASQKPQMHPDVSRLYEVSRQLLSELSPKSGLTRGATDESPGTATEAKIMASGEVIDIDARIDDIKHFIIDIVLDVAGILSKSLVAPVTVKHTLEDDTDIFNDEDKDGFTDKINVDVDVESMQARNKDVLRRQVIDTLATLEKLEPILNKQGKTVNGEYFINELVDLLTLRDSEDAIIDLPQPVLPPVSPLGPAPAGPPPEMKDSMPPEAIEAGLAQRT